MQYAYSSIKCNLKGSLAISNWLGSPAQVKCSLNAKEMLNQKKEKLVKIVILTLWKVEETKSHRNKLVILVNFFEILFTFHLIYCGVNFIMYTVKD